MTVSRSSARADRPDDRYLHLIADVPFRPVFIVGDHRSGTTLLHRLLAETGGFNYLSAYHVIRYNEVLTHHVEGTTAVEKAKLAAHFEQLGLKNRIIDDVPATPEAPVEYGFILAAALNTRRALLTPKAQGTFLELCRKMQFVSDRNRPLLLKNPWDVLNFMDIRASVPGARFIFIHRHPLAVMTSQVRAIRSLLETRNPFVAMLAPWYARLHDQPLQLRVARALDAAPLHLWPRLVGFHTVRAARYFLGHIDALPQAEYVSIRYEDLCRQPDEMMGRILRFAGATPGAPIAWRERINPRPPKVTPDAILAYRRIVGRLGPYLKYHGYEAEPEWLLRST